MLGAGGRILGGGPVDIRRSASRAIMIGLVRGAHSYSQGAGGFDQVPALPQLQKFRAPSQPNRDMAMTQLYATSPALFRQRLQAMFTPGRERAQTGR